jgi:hypothetical protein
MMCTCAEEPGLTMTVDPVTRYVHVRYPVPSDATDEVVVRCAWSPPGANAWRPAKVFPLISETALGLVRVDEWGKWVRQGEVVERRAAGLERTVVFNPYPEAQQDGRVDVDFHVEIHSTDGELLGTRQERIQTDNTDVVYIEDWSGVLQRDAVSVAASPEERKWWWRTGLEAEMGATFGNGLSGASPPYLGLPPLSYPLNLQGVYAVFVCTVPDAGAIGLRLSGDERTDRLVSRLPGEEVLWRWPKMDRQHLVLKQPHEYTGWAAAGIDYVKLVPLTDDLARSLDASFQGEVDKLIAGYWEPYSWAFNEDVQETLQHREPLSAFAEARIAIVDTQIGRFGMKVVYESRVTDPLFYATIGDPIGAIVQPRTDNVGRMQQFTNTLDATLRYARELGFTAHANFGASNCYPGSPLQGDFSKAHPEWMRGSALRYETPEVRAYALGLYREALEIGAPGVSIDFCRYPETIDTAETCNTFLRDLRALTDEFSRLRGTHVPILVRFPGTGVRLNELFDYPTWIRERWVDYLCPSNIQGRHHHIDVTPYLEAAQGSECTLLPVVDGLSWGLPMPGPFLWRVAQLYEAGAPGVYIYQADGRVLGRPEDRRCMRLLASSENVRQWWEAQDRMRPLCSKGIYITAPHQIEGYNRWERLRIWSEGVPTGPMETYLDGQLVGRVEGPPYLVGSEDTASDAVIPPGDHQLRIRAQDGEGWLEQTFAVHGAG